MNLLIAEKISKSYSEKVLLQDVTLGIGEGDKIGVIGVNGTGKSTLLKIIAGLEQPETGTVTTAGGVRVGYLPQNPLFEENNTVLEQVLQGVAQSSREAKSYECKTILTKLGISDFDAPVSILSGGQKKRVAMAAALVHDVEVLVLDEPTNHIDNDMVDWLEKYLARYTGALLMVTHDRYFLDRVTNKIVELQNGSLYSYAANYSQYLELRAQREEMEVASQRKRQSFLRKELEWIQRGARARGTKSQYRIDRFEEMTSQSNALGQGALELGSGSSRLGKKIVELNGISKGYDSHMLIDDFSYNLLRNDRVGIIGTNGCGKSTLLKMIAGKIPADSGSIDIGSTVKMGYFSQEAEEMDLNERPYDYIKNIAPEIVTPEGTLSASQMMEKFLFDGTLQYSTIGRLSGGERRRLFLLRVLMEAPNVLLLDEPTNDLDIQTLCILEDYLQGFAGAVITVSHDRYFLDKVVHHVFSFEEEGIAHYIGGYSDYLELHKQEKRAKEAPAKKEQQPARERTGKEKFSFKEQREYEEIDDTIAGLEQQLASAEEELIQQASNYSLLPDLMARKSQLEQLLAEKLERWVYLNDLAEKIAAQAEK